MKELTGDTGQTGAHTAHRSSLPVALASPPFVRKASKEIVVFVIWGVGGRVSIPESTQNPNLEALCVEPLLSYLQFTWTMYFMFVTFLDPLI